MSAVARATALLAEPERESRRLAKAQRRHALDEFKRALDAIPPRHSLAVRAYVAALHAGAAAIRAEADDLRDALTAVVADERGTA